MGAASLADCLPTDSTTSSQMACCAGSDHDCGAAGVEQGCCPTGSREWSEVSTSAIAKVHPLPVVTSVPAMWVMAPSDDVKCASAVEAFDREILKLPERPTYLLVSAFLI